MSKKHDIVVVTQGNFEVGDRVIWIRDLFKKNAVVKDCDIGVVTDVKEYTFKNGETEIAVYTANFGDGEEYGCSIDQIAKVMPDVLT